MKPESKPVFVELGGKTRELRYPFRSMLKYEEMVGTGLEQSLMNIGLRTLLAMYTAGLMHEDKGITPQRVMKMLEKEMDNGKTDEDLFKPAIEALYQSGKLREEIYKSFKESVGDDYGSDSDEDYDDDEDEDEVKNA